MVKHPNDDQCIEVDYLGLGPHLLFSVAAYDEAQQRARSFSRRALAFQEVRWTYGALPVQKLTTEWQATSDARVRVCDAEVYGFQMRRLLGLA